MVEDPQGDERCSLTSTVLHADPGQVDAGFPVGGALRCLVLGSWRGAGPARTRGISPARRGPKVPPGCPLPPPPRQGAATYCSSLPWCGLVCGQAFVLLWVISGMLRQAAREQAAGLVTDRHAGPLAGPFASGWRRATGGICPARRGMRAAPQGSMRVPMSEGGAAPGGALREPAETGAAFDEADSAARPRAARLAVALWADITKGGQEGRGGGGASAESCGNSCGRPGPQR